MHMTRVLVCGILLIILSVIPPQAGVAISLKGAPPPGPHSAGPARALTLKQAWQIALREARARWSNQALVAEIGSIDTEGDTIQSGRRGRRRSWTATIVAPNQPGAQLHEEIVDGVVVEATREPFPAKAPSMRRMPRIDSDATLSVAIKARPDIGPGRTGEHGYGFIAHGDTHGRMIIAVMGSYRDHPAQVDIDAVSGRVLGALIYTFPSTVLSSGNGGQRWRTSNLRGGFVAGIAAVPGSLGMGYAVETGIRAVRLWKTSDGGRLWAIAGALSPRAATSAHGLAVERLAGSTTVIAVGTNSGLWYSSNGGTSWQRSIGLPAGAVQWLAPGWLTGDRALLVSVFTGPGRGGVYASTNLHTWRKIVSEADRLSPSANSMATMAFSEDSPGTAFLNTRGDVAHRITLPLPALSAAGQFGSGGVELAQAPDRVMVSRDGGVHWATALDQQTTQQPLDQVAVSPAFPVDGVALVAGFNGGLFRSADAGKSWHKVENFPVTARDEVCQLAFLQPSQVVVVSSGLGEWQPF